MPVTKDEKSAINQALIRVLRQQGINISENRDVLGDLFANETTGPITLYVETTGSDVNPGTKGAPLATIQEAIDRLPKRIKHPVNIYVGAGTFAPFIVSAFNIGPENAKSSGYLSVQGTLQIWTPATGSSSGTATGGTAGVGSTFGTLVKSGENWTVNDLMGKFVEITGGTGSGQIFPITSNTIDTITIAGTWTAPTGTSTFVIRDCGTVINDVVYMPDEGNAAIAAGSSGNGCVLFYNNNSVSRASTTSNLILKKIKCFPTGTAKNGLRLVGGFKHLIENCVFGASGSAAYAIFGQQGGSLTVQKCYIYSEAGPGACFFGTNVGGEPKAVSVSNCFINGNGGSGILAYWNSAMTILNTKIFNSNQAVAYYGCVPTSCRVNSCIIDANNLATSYGVIVWSAAGGAGFGAGGGIDINSVNISNCTVAAITLAANISLSALAVTGSGNSVVFNISRGARVLAYSNTSITGSTEISLDGAPYTLADMRAASPKLLTNTYGTIIYE